MGKLVIPSPTNILIDTANRVKTPIDPLEFIFKFTYLSLNNDYLCFDYKDINAKQYKALMKRLSELSKINIQQAKFGGNSYRFHEVDFDEAEIITKHTFKKHLENIGQCKINDYDVPELYQFSTGGKERALGFINNKGHFNIVYYDIDHKVYPRK